MSTRKKKAAPLPTGVRVGGFVYPFRQLTTEEMDRYYGLCTRGPGSEGRHIGLDLAASGADAADTAIHEVLHAIMHEKNISYLMKHVEDPEEFVVANVANALVELTRRNPDFITWFVENAQK